MNRQREFINQTFHVLAQPITALRATLELGLSDSAGAQFSPQVLEDCLSLIDRLMQDLAVFREIASLDETPPLRSCCGQALLQNCVEEMAPISEACGVALRLSAEPVAIQCNQSMFERALFVVLDEMIACTLSGGEISLSLSRSAAGVQLELRPGTLRGQRQTLCLKMMQFAGGSNIRSVAGCTSVTFQESSWQHSASTNDQASGLRESRSRNEVASYR
jgi:hypothetical protein